jgi:hypothetical protein
VTSIIKACKLQCAQLAAEAAETHGAEAEAGVPAGLQLAVLQCVLPVAEMLHCLAAELAALLPQAAATSSAAHECGSISNDRSASSTGSGNEQQQQTATAVLLAVLLARSLVVLADAAGWLTVLQDATGCLARAVTAGDSSSSSIADMQQAADEAEAADDLTAAFIDWQDSVILVVKTVHHTCQLLGLGSTAQPCSSGCSSNSSGSSVRVCWAYLLQLARSKKLAAACDKMASAASHYEEAMALGDKTDSKYAHTDDHKGFCEPTTAAAALLLAAAHSRNQAANEMYGAALQFCRVLAGAAPLPHLCNNLGCSSLAAGGTEAAAAVKVCSGCGAWYCSAGCAAAHWRQHKKACRRMRALGLSLNR